jgi:sec-independent protein translocase protein TatB
MFGLGMSELILLGVLALILIGPKQLPEVARTLGRFINDLKRSAEGLTDEIKKQATVDLDLDSLDPRKDQKKKKKQAEEFVPLPDPENSTYNHEEAMQSDVPIVKIEPPDQHTATFNPSAGTDTDEKTEKKE